MSIERRRFMKSLLVAPAVPAALAAQQAASSGASTSHAAATTPPQPTPKPNTPANQAPQEPRKPEIAFLEITDSDLTAETEPHFFNPAQFAALVRLGDLFMPPLNGSPGALEAGAPAFLDFLVSASPADRQTLYRNGLDTLNRQAQASYSKPFAQLDDTQAGAIVRPLLVARFWPEDMPSDPMRNFIAQAHRDLRTATMNSRPYVEALAKSPHRFSRGGRGAGLYWKPIDPIAQG